MLKKMNWVTFAIVVAMIGGLVLAVRAGMTPSEITAFAGAGFALATQLEKMFGAPAPTPPDDKKPPPPTGGGSVGMLLVVVLLVRGVIACFPEAKEVVADASYEAQQLACVDQYANRADIDRCRQKVSLAWRVDAGAADAGRTLNFANDNDAGQSRTDQLLSALDAGTTDAQATIVRDMQASAARSNALLEAGLATLDGGSK